MAKIAPEGLITALDIGSSKVSALIARKGDGGELIVLGTGQRESRGVKRGYIADMGATEAAVREAVEQAERIAGLNIENVWVGFSAGGLVSDVAEVEFELGGHQVEQGDIDALLAAGRNSIDPQGRMVLHAQPALYTLDGLTGVKKPLGLHAEPLGRVEIWKGMWLVVAVLHDGVISRDDALEGALEAHALQRLLDVAPTT